MSNQTYIGRTFKKDGYTFQVWKYSQPINPDGMGEYDIVALEDPTKPVQTVEYFNNGKTILHKLANVLPDTHVSIPANKMKQVLSDPSTLVLTKKKVITVSPKKAA